MKFTSICTILDPLINPSCKYGGGIPGDNRHWSNSGRRDPGKLLVAILMQPVSINSSHLRCGQEDKHQNVVRENWAHWWCSLKPFSSNIFWRSPNQVLNAIDFYLTSAEKKGWIKRTTWVSSAVTEWWWTIYKVNPEEYLNYSEVMNIISQE